MWVFWIIVRLNKKIKNKNPMKYDDVNEEENAENVKRRRTTLYTNTH